MATRTLYAREAVISYRRLDVQDGAGGFVGLRARSSADIPRAARAWIGSAAAEHFAVFALDARNTLIAGAIVGVGGTTTCPVSAAEVLRVALLAGAPAIIVAHNHPSGDARPSPEDMALTKALKAACETIGIRLLDHVIVTDRDSYSFLDAGLL